MMKSSSKNYFGYFCSLFYYFRMSLFSYAEKALISQ